MEDTELKKTYGIPKKTYGTEIRVAGFPKTI